MLPFLEALDMVRLRQVSVGMKECVDVGSKNILANRKKNLSVYYEYINKQFSNKTLLQASMLEHLKGAMKQGIRKVSNQNSLYTCNEAYMSVLIFYLRLRCPRDLNHMLHCVVPKWSNFNRRLFRRVHLKVEMYLMRKQKRYSCKRPINGCASQYQQPNSKKPLFMSKASSSTVKQTAMRSNSLPTLSLTEENLHAHNENSNKKRKRIQPKRVLKKAKRYSDEFQKDVVVKDDFREEEGASECDTEECMEKRSVDSQSEGSLKDFIVNDDDEDEEDFGSEREEDELSDRETDQDSVHTSDMSGVFSDDDAEDE